MRPKWRCRSPRTFFGLNSEYMENVYEQFFFLKYNGGWSFSEAYNLPVGLRKWFTERLIKQIEDENEAIEQASNGDKNSSRHELNSETQNLLPYNLRKKQG